MHTLRCTCTYWMDYVKPPLKRANRFQVKGRLFNAWGECNFWVIFGRNAGFGAKTKTVGSLKEKEVQWKKQEAPKTQTGGLPFRSAIWVENDAKAHMAFSLRVPQEQNPKERQEIIGVYSAICCQGSTKGWWPTMAPWTSLVHALRAVIYWKVAACLGPNCRKILWIVTALFE